MYIYIYVYIHVLPNKDINTHKPTRYILKVPTDRTFIFDAFHEVLPIQRLLIFV